MMAAAAVAMEAPRAGESKAEAMDMDTIGGSVAQPPTKRGKRVQFAGSEYIEYDLAAAPVVRLCGATGMRGERDAAELALELKARRSSELESQQDVDMDAEELAADETALRQQLEHEYAREMREAIEERGLPCVDESVVDMRTQFKLSEVLVAWSVIVCDIENEQERDDDQDSDNDDTTTNQQASEDDDEHKTSEDKLFDASESLETQRKRLELCRKQVFGPVVDGYVFGRRFFSIESFLLTLEFEELVELANSHGIEVPPLPKDVIDDIKVTDRELIATYSPTGLGKPLKMLTFRELVEEAYARGILMDDARVVAQKKSKRAWVDALRPVLHGEMVVFKIREAYTELLHDHLAVALEEKMQTNRTATIVRLVRSYLASITDDSNPTKAVDQEAMHRYFRAIVEWHDAKTRPPRIENEPTASTETAAPVETAMAADEAPARTPPSPEV